MTIIITIVDDEESRGSYYVGKIEDVTVDEVEQTISPVLWEKFSKRRY